MRYSVEHQRNIAYDLLWLDQNNIELSDYFEKNEPIMIYGFDFLGKEIYRRVKDRCRVVGFLDRSYNGKIYNGTKIYSLENEELFEMVKNIPNMKIIIVIISDIEQIKKDLLEKLNGSIPLSIYQVTGLLKMESELFQKKYGEHTVSVLKDMIVGRTTTIQNIIVLGTVYTELLSMLYLKNWEKSLFIFERFVPEEIGTYLVDLGIPCLYETEAVEFYSITYMIAEYANKKKIPIFGQDHMQMSRAFLKNEIIVIEDGIANYDVKYALRYPIYLDEIRNYVPFGYDELVKKVVLTGISKIPDQLKEKCEIINAHQLWKQKDSAEKKLICQLFGFSLESMENREETRDILFLTEPRNDGVFFIEQEIQIEKYKNILQKYDLQRVLIKPHPLDDVDYELFFPECKILERKFPVQFLEWVNYPLQKVIMMEKSSCRNLFEGFCDKVFFD